MKYNVTHATLGKGGVLLWKLFDCGKRRNRHYIILYSRDCQGRIAKTYRELSTIESGKAEAPYQGLFKGTFNSHPYCFN